MENIDQVFRFISSYMIAGILPLDKLLHFLFGLIITVILLKKKYTLKSVFILLLILELSKEYYDSYVMTNTLVENILDFLTTFIYPVIIYLVRKFKSSRFSKGS